MKNGLVAIVFIFLLNFVTPKTFAETSVHIENNGNGASSDVHVNNNVGQNTTCVNGNCSTTSNGNNSTTVCINGNCSTSQDSNVDRQEGGASVHIQNNSNSSSSVHSSAPTGQETAPMTDQSPTATITPLRQGSEGQAPKNEASHSAQKQEVNKPQQSSIEQMIDNIRKFFTDLFSTNK